MSFQSWLQIYVAQKWGQFQWYIPLTHTFFLRFSAGIKKEAKLFLSYCPQRRRAWLHSFKRRKFPLIRSSECISPTPFLCDCISCAVKIRWAWKWCVVLSCDVWPLWMLVHQCLAQAECMGFVNNGGSRMHAENEIWQLNACDHVRSLWSVISAVRMKLLSQSPQVWFCLLLVSVTVFTKMSWFNQNAQLI